MVDDPYPHIPVMLTRCVELIARGVTAVRESGHTPVVADMTLGMGGHSAGILAAAPDIEVIGIDRDPEALDVARRRLAGFGSRFHAVQATDDELPQVLADHGVDALAGALFDLGVSSLQLDDDERGFSYARDTALDMRMDQSGPLTAADVLNGYSEERLRTVLREYGEERQAARIARVIVTDRSQRPWRTTAQLAQMIGRVVPDPPGKRKRSHPAKRTFQALRIEVNDELGILSRALPAALHALAVGGTCVVESYQSLEDGIVKRIFRQGSTVQAPPDLPVVPEHLQPWLREIVRGAHKATAAEIADNPRAASVRLRAVEKIREEVR